MIRRAIQLALLLGAAVALGSCSGPVAGDLTVSLVTPNSDDGAVLLKVTASESKEVTSASAACSGCQIFMEKVSATELRAVITGNVVAGALARVSVSDTRSPSSYSVQIQQVASRSYQSRSISPYSATVQ